MEIIYGSADLYDTTDPGKLKEEEKVKKIIEQVEKDYQQKHLQGKYFFEIHQKEYYAQVIRKKGTAQIRIRKKYTLKTLVRDIIDSFI